MALDGNVLADEIIAAVDAVIASLEFPITDPLQFRLSLMRAYGVPIADHVQAELNAISDSVKTDIDTGIVGVQDGTNKQFTTPDIFLERSIHIYRSGQRLKRINDFTVLESGGVGTGFDTFVLEIAPRTRDNLVVDYIVDLTI